MIPGMSTFNPEDVDPERREIVKLLGSFAAAGMMGCAGAGARAASESPAEPASPVGSCVVRPQQTEGPFFVDEKLNRSDLRTDPLTGLAQPGVPLSLTFQVSRTSAGMCGPLAGTMVDVWHCDAVGAYSDVGGAGRGGEVPARLPGDRRRGGARAFQRRSTPAEYRGRAVHVHFKVRASPARCALEFTSQLYFDDAVTDAVFRAARPYSGRGERDTPTSATACSPAAGSQLLLPVTRRDGSGYAGTFDIALQV